MARSKLIKKKEWVNLIAPSWLGGHVVGETYVEDSDLVLGRLANVNLSSVTGEAQRQSIQLKFRAKEKTDRGIICELEDYLILPAVVKRLVRKGRNKIDMSFLTTSKEGIDLRIKLLLVTKSRTTGVILSKIHHVTQDFIKSEIKKLTVPTIFELIIKKNLQKSLSNAVKKTFPLSIAEFRQVSIVGKALQSNNNEAIVKESVKPIEA